MSKRKTKAQREQEQRGALLTRLLDMYSAANQGVLDADDPVLPSVLAVVLPLIRTTFGETKRDWWGFRLHMLGRFETPEGACDFLFEHGFRANREWEATDA